MGTAIVDGSARLMLAFQTDGVYSIVNGATSWSRVFSQTSDTLWHTWRVTVDSEGLARLYQDGGQSLASWGIQGAYTNTNPMTEHWVDAVSGNGAEARVDWLSLTEGIVANDFIDLIGLTVDSSGGATEINPSSQLHLRSANGSNSSVTVTNGPGSGSRFSVEFRGKVNTYTVANPTTGVSLGLKVHNGSHRLMLAIQSDGVYSFLSGGSAWSKVYNTTNDANWHTWRVDVDTSGAAKLYCDGGTVLATWNLQADTNYARLSFWNTGSSANPAEARIDWVKLD
jgi:hypothetical protein